MTTNPLLKGTITVQNPPVNGTNNLKKSPVNGKNNTKNLSIIGINTPEISPVNGQNRPVNNQEKSNVTGQTTPVNTPEISPLTGQNTPVAGNVLDEKSNVTGQNTPEISPNFIPFKPLGSDWTEEKYVSQYLKYLENIKNACIKKCKVWGCDKVKKKCEEEYDISKKNQLGYKETKWGWFWDIATQFGFTSEILFKVEKVNGDYELFESFLVDSYRPNSDSWKIITKYLEEDDQNNLENENIVYLVCHRDKFASYCSKTNKQPKNLVFKTSVLPDKGNRMYFMYSLVLGSNMNFIGGIYPYRANPNGNKLIPFKQIKTGGFGISGFGPSSRNDKPYVPENAILARSKRHFKTILEPGATNRQYSSPSGAIYYFIIQKAYEMYKLNLEGNTDEEVYKGNIISQTELEKRYGNDFDEYIKYLESQPKIGGKRKSNPLTRKRKSKKRHTRKHRSKV